tara:strand:+ start:4528 stop:5742 length:1215 start_codon:yes stop_codon:yes gene_type:complete
LKLKIFNSKGIFEAKKNNLANELSELSQKKVVPFSEKRIKILSELSKRFLKSKFGNSHPQIIVLGYWLRPSSIKSFRDEYLENLPKNCIPSAKGIAFHLPPQNVDTMFVYSWAISFLMGNINVVRLPTELNSLSDWIIREIIKVLEENQEANKNLFCNYPLNSNSNSELSSICDLRIVWGGNKKIETISNLKLKPSASCINFPDRQSLCLINSNEFESQDSDKKNEIAEKLFNDIFWFDQMGCGSPKAIIYYGKPKDKLDLYNRLVNIVQKKKKSPDTSTVISKFVNLNEVSGKGISTKSYSINNILNVSEVNIDNSIYDYFHGGGSIFHIEIEDLDEIIPLLSDKTQTISSFGFNSSDKDKLLNLMSTYGGLRLVNIGNALSFDKIWDGIDLFGSMSKLIKVD